MICMLQHEPVRQIITTSGWTVREEIIPVVASASTKQRATQPMPTVKRATRVRLADTLYRYPEPTR